MPVETDSHLFSTVDEPETGGNGSLNEPSAVTAPPDIEMINNDSEQRKQRQSELRALGKTRGHIPGVPIFSTWERRQDCTNAAVHRPITAGICGNKDDGVFSLVVSDGYPDDEDGGDTIIYTGSGGKKTMTDTVPPKPLRGGRQIRDQSWDDPRNRALIKSHYTGDPIRVIRSWRCVSKYAPVAGYRYDGLYQLVAHWSARGKEGFSMCRCRLERLPGQPPLPIRPATISTAKGRKRGPNLISSPRDSGSSSSSGTSIPSSTSSHDSAIDSDASNFDVESPRQRRRVDEAGHAVLVSTPSQGASGASQQPTIPEPPAPLTVEDTDTKIPLQSLGDRQTVPRKDLDSLPNYRWDSNTNALVEVPRPVPGELVAPDASMDGYQSEHEDVDMDPENRMPTEYFTDDDTLDREFEVPYGPDDSEVGLLDRHDGEA